MPMSQRQKYKPLQKYNVMHRLAQVPKGVVQKQAKGKW